MQLLEAPHLFTVEEYMGLDIEARTELLGGVIYDVSRRNEPHRYAVSKLHRVLALGLDARYIVRSQDSVAISGWQGRDAPEVDVAVLEDRFYRPGPRATDARALVEVSDTTYAIDRRYKMPLYVGAGVPSYIVNIAERRVECYESADDLEREFGRILSERDTWTIVGVSFLVSLLFESRENT